MAAEHDITADEADLFDKTGGRDGGILKCADHASIMGNRPATQGAVD